MLHLLSRGHGYHRCVRSDYEPVPTWLDAESSQDARRVLGALGAASRSPAEWTTIAEAVGRLDAALSSGDMSQVTSAIALLERMTGPRADDIDPKDDTPPPPPLQDRMVHLQRRLDADVDQFGEGGKERPDRK